MAAVAHQHKDMVALLARARSWQIFRRFARRSPITPPIVLERDGHPSPAVGSYGAVQLSLVLVTAIAAIVAYEASHLMRHPVPAGLDGYYYVLQITQLRDHGNLYFPSATPLLFYLLYALDLAINDPVLTVKIGAIALHALLCAGLFFNVFTVTRNIWLSVLSCFLATASPLHFFWVGEFLKNLLAITLLTWCGFCIQRALTARRSGWWILSLVLLTLALISHKSAAGIACLLAVILLLLRWLLSPASGDGRRIYPLLLLFLMLTAPLILKWQPFVDLRPSLLAEVAGGRRWQIPPPAEALVLMLLTAATLYLVASLRDRLQNGALMFLSLIAVWAALISVNPFLNPKGDWDSLFGRLKGLAYIQVAVLVPGLLWLVRVALGRWLVYPLVALPLLFVAVKGGPPPTMSDAVLSRRAQLARNLPAFRQHLCADPVVIATHGDQFLASHALRVRSQKEWPRGGAHQCIYWLLNMVREDMLPTSGYVVAEESLRSYAAVVRDRGDARLYSIVIRDEDLTGAISLLPVEKRRWLLSFNQHLSRYLEARGAPPG